MSESVQHDEQCSSLHAEGLTQQTLFILRESKQTQEPEYFFFEATGGKTATYSGPYTGFPELGFVEVFSFCHTLTL